MNITGSEPCSPHVPTVLLTVTQLLASGKLLGPTSPSGPPNTVPVSPAPPAPYLAKWLLIQPDQALFLCCVPPPHPTIHRRWWIPVSTMLPHVTGSAQGYRESDRDETQVSQYF